VIKGYSPDLIVHPCLAEGETVGSPACACAVAAVAAWLPRPDAGELLSLAAVGAVYAQLDDGNAGAGAGATATTTAAALFAGVDAALDPYRATVLALEQRVLDESRPPPGLAEVRLALGEWPTLLPALAALAADAKNYHAWSHRCLVAGLVRSVPLWESEREVAGGAIEEDKRERLWA
jgi:hypothetical protein